MYLATPKQATLRLSNTEAELKKRIDAKSAQQAKQGAQSCSS